MGTSIFNSITRSWWVLVVYGVIAVLFGLGAFVWPIATAVSLTWAFGIMALAEGIISVLALFDKNVIISKGWLALYAAVSIIFGLLAIAQPLSVAGSMLLLLAAWLIVAGVYRIVFAIRVRKTIDNEWTLIISGALAIILGLLFAAYPIAGLLTIIIWIGVAALIYGVLQIVAGFRLRSLAK